MELAKLPWLYVLPFLAGSILKFNPILNASFSTLSRTMAETTPTKARPQQSKEKKPETGSPCVDSHEPREDQLEFEFGGSWETLALMVGFPLLMWYMWIGATYYNRKFPLPEDSQSWTEFGHQLGEAGERGSFSSLASLAHLLDVLYLRGGLLHPLAQL